MRPFLLAVAALPLASFALTINHFDDHFNGEAENTTHENGTTSCGYQLQHSYEGDGFFECAEGRLFFLSPVLSYHCSDWNFFSGPDPTHGNVAYQTRENSEDLAYVDEDCTVVLRVDNEGSVPVGGQRRS